MKDELIFKALDFATEAHKDQVRKYTGEPYIFHPIEVAQIVWNATEDINAASAALLHDVVEDTDVTAEEILKEFGPEVAELVHFVTKASEHSDGVRAIRKEMDRVHYAKGPALAQTIKLADVISNSVDVVEHDPGFAKIYLVEQGNLVASLTAGDYKLFELATEAIVIAKADLLNS